MRNPMTNVVKSAGLVVVLAVLGACVAPEPAAAPVPKAFTVTSVDVSVAASSGVGRLEDTAAQTAFLQRLDAELDKDAASVGGGSVPAKARVVFTKMQMRDAGARSFGAMNLLQAQVTIVDAKGKVLRGPDLVSFSDQAKNSGMTMNGAHVGLLINLARNSSHQEAGKDQTTMIEGFSTAFTKWLKS
ncbi:MAG: hypothetical protein ABI459_02905 [Deltaproteobacteria bacterium]